MESSDGYGRDDATSEGTATVDPELDVVLRRHVPNLAADAPLRPDDELRTLGVDSLGMMELVLDLESAHGVVFSDDVLVPETFVTVGALAAVVQRLRSA